MLFSPCIICFRRFVFPFFFPTRKCNNSSTTGCSWCYMFPPCVRCSEQQVGHEQQVAAEGKSGFWEPLGDHRSLRSMKCCQGLKCNEEPRSSGAAQRETDCLVQSLDLAPPHRGSDWMTPAERKKLYPVPTCEVSNQSRDCHLLGRRAALANLKVGQNFWTTCGTTRHRCFRRNVLVSAHLTVWMSLSFLLINCLKGEQSKGSDKDGPLSPQKRHWMCKSVLSYLLWGDESLLSSHNFVYAVANLFRSHCEEF